MKSMLVLAPVCGFYSCSKILLQILILINFDAAAFVGDDLEG